MLLVSVRQWHCAVGEENRREFFLPVQRHVISGLCKLGTIVICNGWKGNRQIKWISHTRIWHTFLGQAIYGARIIPTENSFGTPSLQQKRCYRTCAHPPTVCSLRLLFTVSNLSICLLVAVLPSLLISVVLVLGLFVHPSNKRTVVLVSVRIGAVWRSRPTYWSFYIWCFPSRTMRCCVLFSSVSIFLMVMLAGSASA